jgi:hypothetical protein
VKEAMVRKIFDMVSVMMNEKMKNVKKAPTSRRRLAMKYTERFKLMATRIFEGSSVSMDAKASVKGW